MKHVSAHLLILGLSLTGSVLADRSLETIGGTEVKRDDPKIVEALRDPIALGPVAEAFQEALHMEEVARNLDMAAVKYGIIVKKHRERDDDYAGGAAAASLFRLAEIRRKQGRADEARKHYLEVTEEFSDWEPMASLSRQQLGLDPSDFLPMVTIIERKKELADKVIRKLWEVRSRVCDDKFVLVTFETKPTEDSTFDGLPEASKIQTLHYCPGGPLTGHVSSTRVEGGVMRKGKFLGEPIHETLMTRVSGFGHAFDVPAGLREKMALGIVDSDWIGMRESTYDAKMVFAYHDESDEDTKLLSVSFVVATISEAEARELTEECSVAFPEVGERNWSLTLPPSPAAIHGADLDGTSAED